jgi:hypothetical protein
VEEAAYVKVLYFALHPLTKYRIEGVHCERKNSVYGFFSHCHVSFWKQPYEFRTLIEGTLIPLGRTAQATVPIALFTCWKAVPIPEGAIMLCVGFDMPKDTDKVKANMFLRVLA